MPTSTFFFLTQVFPRGSVGKGAFRSREMAKALSMERIAFKLENHSVRDPSHKNSLVFGYLHLVTLCFLQAGNNFQCPTCPCSHPLISQVKENSKPMDYAPCQSHWCTLWRRTRPKRPKTKSFFLTMLFHTCTVTFNAKQLMLPVNAWSFQTPAFLEFSQRGSEVGLPWPCHSYQLWGPPNLFGYGYDFSLPNTLLCPSTSLSSGSTERHTNDCVLGCP